jgi:DNA-binding NarL/FixJ family response regulator
VIQILVVSPTPALRAGLRALLTGDPELVVSMAASLGDNAPEPGVVETNTPLFGVVVATPGGIDLSEPGLQPEQALLLVTEDVQETQELARLELRAWGVISPETTAEALQTAVRALAEGLVVASPGVLRHALAAGARNGIPAFQANEGDEDAPLDPLTERENDVILRLAQGLTNKQIALALGISEHTVKFHVSSIYSKLGVSNRTEAVRKGARRGWIPL